ncbi:MAG: O-antigen ligase family protein [Methylococcales bacterium]|nr:O-antigen ligase family protein [Methylococcales bacterium]
MAKSQKNSLRLPLAGLFGVYLLAPLPIGSNLDWAWLILAAICFLLIAVWCLQYLRDQAALSAVIATPLCRASIGFFLCVVAWQGLQALPIPIDWLDKLPTPAAQLYRQTYSVIAPQAAEEWAAISVDSSITAKMALLSLFYFCLFMLLLLLINSRKRLLLFCYLLLLSGLFQASYGSLMTLSGMEYLLGVKKIDYLGFATGTFVNRNHFAGYLEMTLAIGMGLLMVRTKDKDRTQPVGQGWRRQLRQLLNLVLSGKAIFRLVLVVMVIGLILSRSRMGNGAFFNSLLITSLIAISMSSAFRKPGTYLLLLSIIAIDVFLLGSWFGLEKVVQRMEQTSMATEERIDVDQGLLPMIEDFNWTGSGAGTFYYVFPRNVNSNYGGYDHAHNDYLELTSDLGYLGSSFLAGLVIVSLWQALKALRYRHSSFVRGMGFAGLMGTLSLLIHSSVDFNLQIPANAMLFIAMLAIPMIALSVDKKQIKSNSEFEK